MTVLYCLPYPCRYVFCIEHASERLQAHYRSWLWGFRSNAFLLLYSVEIAKSIYPSPGLFCHQAFECQLCEVSLGACSWPQEATNFFTEVTMGKKLVARVSLLSSSVNLVLAVCFSLRALCRPACNARAPWFRIIRNKDLQQNSRGRRRQRRQNNKTHCTRQKAHVNMWNKADICAVLLSNETSTAPFPRCLQNMADISRTNVHRFVQ